MLGSMPNLYDLRLVAALLAGLLVPAAVTAATLVHGVVTAIDAENLTMTLQPEGSDASMQVRVGPGDVEVPYLNQRIRGKVAEVAGRLTMERIWPADPALEATVAQANRQLRRDTVTRGRNPVRGRNEAMPPFALWNQNGELIQPGQLLRQPWIVNFIFTRCTIPHMCPAAVQRMIELQQAAKEAGLEDLVLVTITFDPEYDTPGILNYYASTRGADFGNYHFLTGDKTAIDDLMRQFGIITVNEDDTINHTMDTILVDRNGRIAFRRPGSRWSVEEFINAVKQLPGP